MTDPKTRSQFWRAVYLAAISNGESNVSARMKAFVGVDDLVSFTRRDHRGVRGASTACAHKGKDVDGPCLRNMVDRVSWCAACQAAFDILVGNPES